MSWVVAPAVTGTVVVPGAGRVTLVVIIGRGLMLMPAIMFVSMLPVVVLVTWLRLDV
ncbi:MAG: hypothetical protein V3T84_02665 [Phycisphaerales bacterium]